MSRLCLFWILLITLLCAATATAATTRSPAPAEAQVYFIAPMNGAHVSGKFRVQFGLRGMGVAPAGVDVANTGHHHLLINTPLPTDLSEALPASDGVRHFGKGQTETELELPPGTYTLQLLLGNHLHIPHQPPVMSGTIEITVDK